MKDVRRSHQKSNKRSFDYLLGKIEEALGARRESLNLASVQQQLADRSGPYNALAAPLLPTGAEEEEDDYSALPVVATGSRA